MPTTQQIRDALLAGALAKRADDIVGRAQPAVQLLATRTSLTSLALGASRIGGIPDMPEGTKWPMWKGEPQSFVAQLNLADLPRPEGLDTLPEDGQLLFFYSARQDTWGFDPNDRSSWWVCHAPVDTPLRRAQPPASIPDGGTFPPCALAFEPTVTLPAWESPQVDELQLDQAHADVYFDLSDDVLTRERHQLLGHPDQIQGNMEEECQLVSNGLYLGDSTGRKDPRAADLIADSDQWRLLLQVVSDPVAEMMWGDCGHIYYWIRRDDLAQGIVDRSWMILQCY